MPMPSWTTEERDAKFIAHAARLGVTVRSEAIANNYSTYNYAVYCHTILSTGTTRYSPEQIDQHVKNMARVMNARLHYKENLEKSDSKSRKAGNCYHVGSHTVMHKDGRSLNDDDKDAIRLVTYGQGHHVKYSDDGLRAFVQWECDSGD
jgi:hypothetical protein